MELCREALTNPVYGPRPPGDRSAAVAIVLTDGVANEGQITIVEAARRMALSGVKSLAVGAGPGIDDAQLLEIAQGRQANVFSVGSTAELVDIAQNIGVSSCADIDTTTTATTPAEADCKWGDWSPCDAPCGGGIQRRSMDCCDCTPRVAIRSCNRDPCPVDGAWGPWSAFGACSRSCGGGEQIRTRSCNSPPVAGDGQPCQGPSAEIQACNDQGCPVDGQWGDWCCSWSACSATCGGGQRTRTRQCSNPAPANGGADCVGSGIEEEMCNTQPCPTDGGWSNWSDWSACNVNSCTCSRTRTCSSPAPENGGKPCMGDLVNRRACFVFCCLPDFSRSLGLGGRLPGPFGGMGFGGMGGGRSLGGKSWMRC
ncbi:hemicentin-1-like [Lingula anatina]|uniref:Hemicentin-1-like n=1 Tax=Lingula anatina TaxID=7574 RepID=A0A1S3IUG6_LINAN|nr:hemicentin-1-like [Lingula anatina]|eukprot:XP_013401718.1 hemicentin-1-like [Lingula anatina]